MLSATPAAAAGWTSTCAYWTALWCWSVAVIAKSTDDESALVGVPLRTPVCSSHCQPVSCWRGSKR